MLQAEATDWNEREIADLCARVERLRESMSAVITGQGEVIDALMVCLLAGGHALLEGVPGVGKTLLVKSLAEATDLQFRRVQFTPDLMPADILGTEILEEDALTRARSFRFQQGPVFTQVLLADEINRAPPKTQSALLEAMQEGAVTVAGHTHRLPKPFFVLATQNPIEQSGTYPLPEAQLDRFLMRIDVGYPDEYDEMTMVARTTAAPLAAAALALDVATLQRLQLLVRDIAIGEHLLSYATRLVRATRPQLSGGGQCAAPRGLGRRPARRPGAGDRVQGARADGRPAGRHARRHRRHAAAGAGTPRAAQFRGRGGRRGRQRHPRRAASGHPGRLSRPCRRQPRCWRAPPTSI